MAVVITTIVAVKAATTGINSARLWGSPTDLRQKNVSHMKKALNATTALRVPTIVNMNDCSLTGYLLFIAILQTRFMGAEARLRKL